MKRIIAFILAVCLMIPCVAFADDFTLIYDAAGLAAIANNPSGNYRLANDIDLSGVDWKPIPFSGVLDGCCYAIMNLNVTQVGDTHYDSMDGNKLHYDTVGAGLFDVMTNATVRNLMILGANIDITTDADCFCGILGGAGIDVQIINSKIEGRVTLRQHGAMGGVSGVLGYASQSLYGSIVNAELVYVDNDHTNPVEEFAGGVVACGYGDITNCNIKVDMYCSVHGYCHNGGLIGMFSRGASSSAKSEITGNTVACRLKFFEDIKSRRAYGELYIGEELSDGLTLKNNTDAGFTKKETKDFDVDLYPCTCTVEATAEVVAPNGTDYGYTLHTCPSCGYTWKDSYTSP